jgi:hypothetical protein
MQRPAKSPASMRLKKTGVMPVFYWQKADKGMENFLWAIYYSAIDVE